MSDSDVAKALNRVADALFQQAKSNQRTAKAVERGADIQQAALEVHQQNAAVSAQLEKALANAAGRRDS